MANWNGPLEVIDDSRLRIPRSYNPKMRVDGVIYASAELLRVVAILIQPIMPGAAERLWEQLGVGEPLAHQRVPSSVSWGGLKPGTRSTKGGALFPRLDTE